MARNVGSIEVTVDANTGKLTAQLRTAGKTGGQSYASAFEEELGDISGREMLARLKLIRAKAESDLRSIELEVGLDDKAVRAGLKELDARLKAAQLELEVNTELDTAVFEGELAALRSLIRDVRIDVSGDVDAGDWLAIRQLVEELLGDVEVDVEPNFQISKWARVKRQINTWSKEMGSSGGSNFTRGFSNAVSDGGQLAALAIISFGDSVAVALEGLAGGAVGVASSAIAGLGAAVGAAIPVLFGFAGALTATIVGFRGVGSALRSIRQGDFDELERNLLDLTPSAQSFVRAFEGISPALDSIRDAAQEELFRGMGEELNRLSRGGVLGDVEEAFRIAAGSVNEFFMQLGAVARETDFTGAMEALDPALDNAFDAASELAATLGPFLEQAGPAAEILSGWVEEAARGFKGWVLDGKLAPALETGMEHLEKWVELIGTAGSLLGTIGSAAAPSGGSLVTALDDILTRWNNFLNTERGQQGLADFFSKSQESISNFEPIIEGLSKAWEILTEEGASERFADVAEQVGESLPAVAEFLSTLSEAQIGTAFLNIVDVLGVLSEAVGLLPDELLSFAAQLYAVNKIVGPLYTNLNKLSKVNLSFGWMAAFNTALTIGVLAFDAWTGRNRAAEEEAEDFGNTMLSVVDSILEGDDAVAKHELALSALEETTRQTVEGNDELQAALNNLGVTTDDLGASLIDMADDGQSGYEALRNLADAAGASETEAAGLAAIVNSTNTNMQGMADDAENLATAFADVPSAVGASTESFEAFAADSEIPLATVVSAATGMSSDLAEQFVAVSEATGTPIASLIEMAGEMEAVQDKARRADFGGFAEEQLINAATTDDATKALVDQAVQLSGLGGSWDEVKNTVTDFTPIYTAYLDLLGKNAVEEGDVAAATDLTTDALLVQMDALAQNQAANEARAEALKAERAEAMSAYQAELDAAEEIREIAATIADSQFGLPEGTAETWINMADAATRASDAASAFSDAMEIIRGGAPEWEESLANAEAAIDELAEGLKMTNEAGEEVDFTPAINAAQGLATAFDLTEEEGRAGMEAAHDFADTILEVGEAGLAAGQDTDVIIGKMNALRGTLEDQLVAWGFSEEAAADYVDTLIGTPEELATIVETPGLFEALSNVEDLTVLYDAAGNPIITQFEALGIDVTEEEALQLRDILETLTGETFTAEVDADVSKGDKVASAFKADLDAIDETKAEPTVELQNHVVTIALMAVELALLDEISNYDATPNITITGYDVSVARILTTSLMLGSLDRFDATPNVTLTNYATTFAQIGNLQRELKELDALSPSVTVSLPGIWDRIGEVQRLDRELEGLRDRTVRVTTLRSGSVPEAMTGELISGPTIRSVGERGLAEAIVPLELPLSQVDPSVRWMAELIRGARGEGTATGPGVTNNWNIYTETEDPAAVAVQVMNQVSAIVAS